MLGATGCHLMALPAALLAALPRLEALDLRSNRFTAVPESLSMGLLPRLAVLRLDGNHIGHVGDGSLQGSPIEALHLSHNRISRLAPRAFANASHLARLDLSYNRIAHLDSGALQQVKRWINLLL